MKWTLWMIGVVSLPALCWASGEELGRDLGPDRYELRTGKPDHKTKISRGLERGLGTPAGLPRRVEVYRDGVQVGQGQAVPLVGMSADALTFKSAKAAQQYVANQMARSGEPSLTEARGKRVLTLSGAKLPPLEKLGQVRDRVWKALGVKSTPPGAIKYSGQGGKALWTSNDQESVAAFKRAKARAALEVKRRSASPEDLRRDMEELEAQLLTADNLLDSEEIRIGEELDDARAQLRAVLSGRKPTTEATPEGGTKVARDGWTHERHGNDVRITRSKRPEFAKAFGQLLPQPPQQRAPKRQARRPARTTPAATTPAAKKQEGHDRKQRKGLTDRIPLGQ